MPSKQLDYIGSLTMQGFPPCHLHARILLVQCPTQRCGNPRHPEMGARASNCRNS